MAAPRSKKASLPAKSKNKTTLRNVFFAFCYAIVPIFFLAFFLLMTMSYEDIFQKSAKIEMSIGTILERIYNYIPRTGELYNHVANHYLTLQVSFGADLLFRILIAIMSAGMIYLLTFFVLGRRPKMQTKDVFVYLGLFCLIMIFETHEAIMYEFAFAHNYVIAILAMTAFLLPYRLKSQNSHPLALVGMILLGLLFGASTEIPPVAVLIILSALSIYTIKKQKVTIKDFYKSHKLQVFGVIGILLGLLFFYGGAGLNVRTNGAYSVTYDYVQLSNIFQEPVITIGKLVWHTWYNMRYLMFAVILLLIILLMEYIKCKRRTRSHFSLQLCIFSFCALFIGASSLIKIHDELYVRFMMPVYIAIFSSVFIFITDIIMDFSKETATLVKISAVVACTISLVMFIDMSYSMIKYHNHIGPIVSECMEIVPAAAPIMKDCAPLDQNMTPSPIFKFSQWSPFSWVTGNNYLKYGHPR